jgi:NDP-sugar pyrophosphorylase family protein
VRALVLAGGFGTRLRPLSCTRPKMLFPIGDRPLIDWTLRNLSRGGVETAVMAVNYMADTLMSYLGPKKYGIEIVYSREQRPLGTGGPIRKARDALGSEPFLVLNGDILIDIDIRLLTEHHEACGGLATVALTPVADPSRYGAVQLDGTRITRFVEKPRRGEEPSNFINAGVYVLDPRIFDYIPEGRSSIEREVFPTLARERLLHGFDTRGLWTDMGVPDDYLKANQMILSLHGGEMKAGGGLIDGRAEMVAPCYLGSGAVVGAGSRIGPNVTICDHAQIGRACHVSNSIIFPGATIDDHATVRDAIIGENATLGRWVNVESGSLVGDYSSIMDGVTITGGVSICPSKEVSESILEHRQVM